MKALPKAKREQLARALKAYREEAGLSRSELAVEAKMAPSSYARIERGDGSGSVASLHQIAVALDVELYEIFRDAAL